MKKRLPILAFCFFTALGLALGAVYDLSLNKAVYNPESLFAAIMEAVGFWPLYLTTAFMFAVMAKGKRLWLKITGGAMCCTVMGILCACGIDYAINRAAPLWIVIVPFIICCAGLIRLFFVKDLQLLKKLWFIGVCGFIYMILNNVVINLLKQLWQRPRFDDMLSAGSLEQFKPWYTLLGPGGSSFPSGHTGAACGVFVLLAMCGLFNYWQKKRGLLLSLCWLYVGLMAAGRVIIGRHFLSDTVAAAAISYAIFYLMNKTKAYRRGMSFALMQSKS